MNLVEVARKMSLSEQAIARPQRLLLVLWVVVATAFLAIFVTDLWLSYPMLAAPCTGEACHYQAIGTAEAAVLATWGLPVPAYALYMLGVSVLPVLFFTALAALMLGRLYPPRESLFYSLTLIVIPVVAITSFDVVADAFPRLTIPIQLIVIVGHLLLMSLFLVFPRSRFEPRWTAIIPVFSAFFGLYPLFFAESFSFSIAQPYFLLLILAAAIIVYRYRRLFNDSERLQTKWVILGILIFFVGVPIWSYTFEIAAPAPGQARLLTTLGGWTLCIITTMALPAAIFIAILRDRLWDIDLILNRTLVYGGVTVVILLIYAVTVGGLSLLWHSQNNLFVSLLATGFIAVLFQPLRERLQRSVNRFMFGERDDPYKVLSRLGRQLQETAVPGHLLPAITQTIRQTLKLPYVAVALNTADGERRLTALTGQPSTVTEEWPLLHQGELVGWLIVAPRSPQEQFTDRERQLLADIAGQAGAAAYAVRLTTALQRSRERLVLAGEEERRRIRRDLHDGLGPTLASQTFKLDAALELLETDPNAAANLLLSLKSQNQSLIADIRRLVYALRPPSLDELGLLVALQVHISQMSLGNNGLKVTVAAAPDPLPPLPAAVEVAAYRIALEGLTNVVRHAQANQCDIFLELASASLIITIRDDGLGLSAGTRSGVGLTSMRERAEELGGNFVMTTDNGKGTQITATLPLLEVNKATPTQLPLVMGIITEAAAWLVAKGIDQWPSPPNDHWRRRIERHIANGELYLATLNGEAIGTIRLTWSDPYWPEETNAGYVHTLAIRNQAHGLKIGTTLLLWAMDESRRQGKQFLRLDCPLHNQRIRAYYEELGFTFCRSVEDHDYAAALYEIELSGKL
jgi:signal transduction histidine kinase/GNAT superfamily N-acetyltransferase